MVFALDGPVMFRLKEKLERELRPGAYVLSNCYQIPGWQALDMQEDIWLYQVKGMDQQKEHMEKLRTVVLADK